MEKQLVSVIIPAYNEEACVNELATRLLCLFEVEIAYDWEVVIVENGSTDRTWDLLTELHNRDSRFKIIRLSRNFGMDGGLTAGLEFVRGDACVFMTADLQDPPELISDFLRMWEQGFENVFGVLTKRTGTGPVRTFNSKAFYWLAGKLTGERIPRNVSDFRLLDRRAYLAIKSMEERNRFVRGLASWVGFKSLGIPMERSERFGGKSKAYSAHVIDLAFKGIFAHSVLPLRFITIFGVSLSVISFLTLLIMIFTWLSQGVPFAGFGTIVTLVVFLFGVMIFMLGIISEYIGLIYEEVKGRPNYIVSTTVGL